MLHGRLAGRDLHEPTNIIVENNTGSTLPALRVVTLDGMGISFPQVRPANPSLYINFGVVYDPIPNGTSGQVCAFGFMRNIDTSAWPNGTLLYSDASGNLTTTVNGGIVAQVVYSHSTYGILYVVTEPDITASAVAWQVTGNAGTSPSANYIGTSDNAGLSIRTNAIERVRISPTGNFGLGISSPEGHFHQKTHTSALSSGLIQWTFSYDTTDSLFHTAETINVNVNEFVRVEVVIAVKETALSKNTGILRRVCGVHNDGLSTDIINDRWLTSEDIKTHNGFRAIFKTSPGALEIQVAGTGGPCHWTGHIIVHRIQG